MATKIYQTTKNRLMNEVIAVLPPNSTMMIAGKKRAKSILEKLNVRDLGHLLDAIRLKKTDHVYQKHVAEHTAHGRDHARKRKANGTHCEECTELLTTDRVSTGEHVFCSTTCFTRFFERGDEKD